MHVVVLNSIIDKAKNDAPLVAMVGTASNIFRAKSLFPARVPAVTFKPAGGDSKQRVGYNASKHRDNSPTLQVEVWIKTTGEDADAIADRLDEIYLSSTPVTNTRSWYRATRSSQYEDDTNMFHVSIRYTFAYSVQDA